jgi:UPF0755 protein
MRRIHALLTLLALAACLFTVSALLPYEPPRSATSGGTLVIRPGEGASSVGRRLANSGVLAPWQRPAFAVLARTTGLKRKLRPGLFQLPSVVSAWSLVRMLENVTPRSLRVTLPEGRTCEDFSGILARNWIGDSASLSSLCHDSSFAASLGIPSTSLEGYLFPDTYLFEGGETARDVWSILHRRHKEVLAEIADSNSACWKRYGEHGTITLASIVEREAAVRKEAPRIAGVFWLRLREQIPLGADPTVRYALRKFTGTLSKTDLSLPSPYNTRLNAGLPPGPIANPGRDAILASMRPDTTGGWLYFVAKDDGSREHFFGRTLNEHVRFKRAAERNRQTSGVMTP